MQDQVQVRSLSPVVQSSTDPTPSESDIPVPSSPSTTTTTSSSSSSPSQSNSLMQMLAEWKKIVKGQRHEPPNANASQPMSYGASNGSQEMFTHLEFQSTSRNRHYQAGFRTYSFLMQQFFHGFPPPPSTGRQLYSTLILVSSPLVLLSSFLIVLYSLHSIVCHLYRISSLVLYTPSISRFLVASTWSADYQSGAELCRMPQIVQVTVPSTNVHSTNYVPAFGKLDNDIVGDR
jgi:hypothetical protein